MNRLNPYAPPAGDSPPPVRAGARASDDPWRYVDLGRIGYSLLFLLVAFGLVTFAAFWIAVSNHQVLRDMAQGLHDQAVVAAYAAEREAMTIAQAILSVVTFVAFLVFVWRASLNARALGAKSLRVAPWWWCGWGLTALGSWLIQSLDAHAVDDRIRLNQWWGIHCLVTIATTILAANMVYRLVRRHRERARTPGYT